MRAMDKRSKRPIPPLEDLQAELKREQNKYRCADALKSTVYTLIVVAAITLLAATLWMPVFQISGSSMVPTLEDGQIVVSMKGADFEQGDLVAFYIGNELMVKRVIAGPNQTVSITEEGVVFVDGEVLDEPYVQDMALGECDLEFPYQVPEARYFLMGDNRSTTVDSRSTAVGCVAMEQIVGKIVFCVWPFENFGVIK